MTQDYNIMGTDGSFESIDKSVLSSEASFEPYENHRKPSEKNEYYSPQKLTNMNEYVTSTKTASTTSAAPQRIATIGSASRASASRGRAAVAAWSEHRPNEFELSYRNEGFRDNSTYSGTRNNSVSTSIAEDTPIIHQTDVEESSGSDYYGNASTLPLRHETNENLAFLNQLNRNVTHDSSGQDKATTTFLPSSSTVKRPPYLSNDSHADSLTYEQKIDNLNFSSFAELRSQPNNSLQSVDIRRPDSYLTAVTANRLSGHPSNSSQGNTAQLEAQISSSIFSRRPKTVYENSDGGDTFTALKPSERQSTYHQRSRSEVLLETDLDLDNTQPIDANGRCHSQPLETSM